MHTLRLAVLRGGLGEGYETSLKSGGTILDHAASRYILQDIFIDRSGTWHLAGVPMLPERALRHADVIVNALQADCGSGGSVQRILDALKVCYTGSRSFSLAQSSNRALVKRALHAAGIKTPHFRVVKRSDPRELARDLFNTFPQPSLIGPIDAHVGSICVHTKEEIVQALSWSFETSEQALVEEYMEGRVVTCGIIEEFRNQPHYSLIPSEIVSSAETDTGFREYNPARFSKEESTVIGNLAKQVHQILGLRHYSRTEFLLHPRRGIYVIRVEGLPSLEVEGSFVQSLAAVGSTPGHFIDHIVSLAQRKS